MRDEDDRELIRGERRRDQGDADWERDPAVEPRDLRIGVLVGRAPDGLPPRPRAAPGSPMRIASMPRPFDTSTPGWQRQGARAALGDLVLDVARDRWRRRRSSG